MTSTAAVTKFVAVGQEIGILSHESTIELIRDARNGDQKARDKIVFSFIRLITSLSHHYLRIPGTQIDDLIHEGVVAILNTIDDFNPLLGVSFKDTFYGRARLRMYEYVRMLASNGYYPRGTPGLLTKGDERLDHNEIIRHTILAIPVQSVAEDYTYLRELHTIARSTTKRQVERDVVDEIIFDYIPAATIATRHNVTTRRIKQLEAKIRNQLMMAANNRMHRKKNK